MNPPPDWLHHIQQAQDFDGLDAQATREVAEALEYFQEAWDIDLSRNVEFGAHPFHAYLLSSNIAGRHFLTWLAGEVRMLTEQPGGEGFLSKLKDPETFHATVAEIETASRLRRARCNFDIEPEVQVRGQTKRPDFKMHAGAGLACSYVEVKYLRRSVTAKREHETILGLRVPRPPFSGVIYQTLAPARLRKINEEIQRLEQEADGTGELQELHKSNVIRLAVGPKDREEEAARWAKDNELELNALAGPLDGGDEVIRVKSAIKSKRAQLPDDYPGIIAIKNPSTFRNAQTVYEALVEIEEEMHRIPNLAFVLIHGTALNNFTPLGHLRRPAHSLALGYRDHVYAEYFSRQRFMVDRVIVLRNCHGAFDNQFGQEATLQLASSVLTGYEPKPMLEADIELSEGEFKRRFSRRSQP